jgi:vacuolar-type H+-ATPase subunit H
MGITEILMRQTEDRAALTVQKGLEAAERRVWEGLKAAQSIVEKAEWQVEQTAQKILAVKHEAEIELHNERKKIVKQLDRKKFSLDDIVEITGYPLEEVIYLLCEPDTEK